MQRWLKLRFIRWALVALAALPVCLFALLGQFSRMVSDDYASVALGLELGPLEHMLYWRSVWTGHYSTPFLFGLLAPFEHILPAVFSVITLVVWTLGLTWLLSILFAATITGTFRLTLAFAIAALTVAASVNAFFTTQSFFWLIASVEYTFPIGLMCSYLALMLTLAKRVGSSSGLVGSALISALLCFICAGFSEMFLAFQLAFMSLLLMLLIIFTPGEIRRNILTLFGAGWLGTLASLAAQWTSPGRVIRTELINEYPQFQPIRDLPQLARHALTDTQQLIVQPETVTGFLLLFTLGLLLSLGAKPVSPPAALSGGAIVRAGRLSYIAVLIVQILFLPLIWTHSSDNPQFLGRFSISFLSVVILNMVLIAGILLVIWRFRDYRALLRRDPRQLSIFVLAGGLAGLSLLAAPQVLAMHSSAQNLLFVTALSFLSVAWWEWTSATVSARDQWLPLLALAWTAVALLSAAALPTVPRLFVGLGDPRHWSAAAFLLVSLGLVWGFAIGQIPGCRSESSIARTRLASAAILVAAYATIVIGQLRLLPDFVAFAREWDDRHALLLDLKSSGETQVEIPPRAFDLKEFVLAGEIVADTEFDEANPDHEIFDYYGFESITLTHDG